MTRLGTVLCLVPLCSTWDRLNAKLLTARDRNSCKLTVKKGSISWRLRRHGVDEVMMGLGSVLFFVRLSSTWDRPNGKLLSAQDRNNFKLVLQ